MDPKMASALGAGKMASSLWLVAVVMTLVSPLPVSSEHNGGFRCPDKSNCSCFTSGLEYYELVCPETGPTTFIVKFTGSYAQLQCRQNVQPEDYSILPTLTIPNSGSRAESFSFNGCPLPTLPLADIVSRLGISKLRALMFQTYGQNLSNTLKRHHFKGLEEVTRLVLSGNGLTDLSDDLFIDMKNLTWLYLRSNKIHLRPDLFKHISKLNLLELGHNYLPELPRGLFKHLTVLKQLNLWQNSLTNLTSDVFDGLESLEELDLSTNNIQTLPRDVFHKLPNLRLLNLYSNNLSSLPNDLFSENPELEFLKLYDNKQSLQTLPGGFLSNKTKLSEVNLYRCKISTLPETLMWGSANIKSVSLKGNIMKEIQNYLFRDQVNLIELNLSDNLITHIADGALQSLKHLKILNLDKNLLEKISGKIFASLVSLEHLSIRENKLQEVSHDTFLLTKQLENVDLSFNSLTLMKDGTTSSGSEDAFGLTSPFQKLEKIQILNLSHNAITEIFSDWRLETSKLRYLDLSFNKVLKISFADINILNNNLTLDLQNNNISEIDFNTLPKHGFRENFQQDVHSTHHAKVLIENNPLHCDCLLYNFVLYQRGKLKNQIKSMVTVDPRSARCVVPKKLEGRLITELKPQEMICPLDNPQSKNPPQCPKNCECDVRPFDLSLIVNCSTSSLDTILLPDTRNQGLHHTELHFEYNMLNSLSQLSTDEMLYNQITRLFVKGNNISSLSNEDIPDLIEILDLRNNNLIHVNASVSYVLNNSTTLKQLWISGNPIACDCENHPFLFFLLSNSKKIMDVAHVRCSDGQRISSFSIRNLCGFTLTLEFSVTVSLSLLFVIIGVTLYHRYYLKGRMRLLVHNLYTIEEEKENKKLHDVFISFSLKDKDFITNKLVPGLESGPNPFKTYLHFQDWVADEWIPTQITRSVHDSRQTLVVLSPNFLESKWGRQEFREAHSHALKEGGRIVVILYRDIGDTDNLDAELQTYISKNKYIRWGDPWFWDKLVYILQNPLNNDVHLPVDNFQNKNGFDEDRLKLIDPSALSTLGQNTPPAYRAHANIIITRGNALHNGIYNSKSTDNIINGSVITKGEKFNGSGKDNIL